MIWFALGVFLGATAVLHLKSRTHLLRRTRIVRHPSHILDTSCEWFNQFLEIFLDYYLDKMLDSSSFLPSNLLNQMNETLQQSSQDQHSQPVDVFINSLRIDDVSINVLSVEVPRSPQRTGVKVFRINLAISIECQAELTVSGTYILRLTLQPKIDHLMLKTVIDLSVLRGYDGLSISLKSIGTSEFDIGWFLPVGPLSISSESAFFNLTRGLFGREIDKLLRKGFTLNAPLPIALEMTTPIPGTTPPKQELEEHELGAGIGSFDEPVIYQTDQPEPTILPTQRRSSWYSKWLRKTE
ncbi:hypothetical protein RCL1_006408 [Eukaryota sp. TZLM3-RCL]